jgi:hypothetical protein
MSQALHDALYDYYFDDMPYGVQKARTGDPYEWVSDRFGADLGISGYGHNSPGIGPEDDPSLEREGADYATEESLEDVTSIGGDSSDELMADVMTNQQGTDVNEEGLPEERLCNMTEAGESCPMHGVEECWANTPAMESAPDPVLERMQEVAGLKKKVADEGTLGALGGGVLGMAATKTPSGAVAGAKLGSALQDRLEKTAEEKETPLQGQYGHPGKLEPVAENADFVSRLKELSGMMRSDKI